MKTLAKGIGTGLRRRWRQSVAAALGTIGAIWLATEILIATSSSAKTFFDSNHTGYLVLVAAAALVTLLGFAYEPHSMSFRIPTTSTDVTLKFGDLFDEQTDLIVPVNEFFDHQLGQIVAADSVHGQLIARVFGSDASRFRAEVDRALGAACGQQTARIAAPNVRYPIGTVAPISVGPRTIYLVALSETDLQTAKATASVPHLWAALTGVLDCIHTLGNGRPIALPLIGNGRASLNLTPQHLLRLVSLCLVDYGRKKQLPNAVTIVMHRNCFAAVDIREISADWGTL